MPMPALSMRARPAPAGAASALQRYQCMACLYVYDERAGDPDDGIHPGTAWARIPAHWTCPDCGRLKSAFTNTSA